MLHFLPASHKPSMICGLQIQAGVKRAGVGRERDMLCRVYFGSLYSVKSFWGWHEFAHSQKKAVWEPNILTT